jgi:hypothetical protein
MDKATAVYAVNRDRVKRHKAGYIVGYTINGIIRFADEPILHKTRQAAETMARNMLKKFPDQTFIVVKMEGYMSHKKVQK